MKLTVQKGKDKVPATTSGSAVEVAQESFAEKLAALRKATGRPERFVSACACALHDRPFTVVYERTDPTKPFTLAQIHAGSPQESGNAGNEGTGLFGFRQTRKSVAAADIDMTGWRCPHCGCADHVVACQSCGTTVCGGRTVRGPGPEDVFNCRPSCGARGTLMEASVVHGVDGAHKAAPRIASPSKGITALPSADRMRLTGPK